MSEPRGRDRGQSTAIDYVLTLGIAAVLIAALVATGGAFVSDQREISARGELRVIGQQIASDLATADRLVRSAGAADQVRLQRGVPRRVAGSTYVIELSSGSPATLNLSADGGDVTVGITLTIQTSVTDSEAGGGTVVIAFDTAANALEVRND
ncbi:MAG: hypothetical protein ABEI11_03925 [Haloarculaceae archaeon]